MRDGELSRLVGEHALAVRATVLEHLQHIADRGFGQVSHSFQLLRGLLAHGKLLAVQLGKKLSDPFRIDRRRSPETFLEEGGALLR